MKCFKLFVLLAAVVATPFALAEGDPEAGKEKAQVCAACHGPDGNSPSGQYPSLAGQGERYLIKQLKAYKSGERENAIMQGQAANLSEQDMQDLAAFFTEQARAAGLNIVTVGREQGDLHADAVRLDDKGCDFVLQPLGLTLRLPLVGAHQISNALMALAAVQALGVDLAERAPRLAQLKPVPGRMNVIDCQGGTLVDDTYNANPGSVRAAIAWLAGRPSPRTLVLGAMGELGPSAETLVTELGANARAAGIDTLITLPGAEAAARGFGDGAEPVEHFDQAAERAAGTLARGGTVLVKGSRSARMEQVVQRLTDKGRGH